MIIDSHSFVGVFWAVQEKGTALLFLHHRCPISQAEGYGEMLTCSHGHYEIWDGWRSSEAGGRSASVSASLIAPYEYEEWPRGRIVYDSTRGRFVLYADAQILSRPDLLAIIYEKFGLPASRTETKRDTHYVSTRRLEPKGKWKQT